MPRAACSAGAYITLTRLLVLRSPRQDFREKERHLEVYLKVSLKKNRSFSRDVITNKDPPKFLSSSGKRGGLFISVNNFSAQ